MIPPNLILMDIRMAQMDGFQVCKRLKTDKRFRDIPVIFISALHDIQDKIKAFEVGGVDYITKPFRVEEVLARIEIHLTLRQLQERLQDANEKLQRELHLAGKMQMSLLPREFPKIPGWQISATLNPAREMSGDFYEIFKLENDLLGILVADVVDKGVEAALLMVLSWSLLRTYTAEDSLNPETVLRKVNERLIQDTGKQQYVTVFYGVLNPNTGELIYSNAGHNRPYIINANNKEKIRKLSTTGIPLGLDEKQTWEQIKTTIDFGDIFILFTDGIPDARNGKGIFYDEDRLLNSILSRSSGSVTSIQKGILKDLVTFTGEKSQFDDITVMVIKRE
jgi:sigma-B regulation protein RsbU (phosphoserine phosphatase)